LCFRGVSWREGPHHLGVLVSTADVMENRPLLDMVWRACFRWQLRPQRTTGDTTYGAVEIIRALSDAGASSRQSEAAR
jgi:hypothetical protein